MNSRLRTIQRRFDRSAESAYDTHANVQRFMASSLSAAIAGLANHCPKPDAVHILEIGCGTGALTAKLADLFPSASITALDLAPAMLKAAQQRLHAAGIQTDRINWILSDIDGWLAEQAASGSASGCGAFDLIVSNACFQWLTGPGDTLTALGRTLRPGGSLAFTTFGPETFQELHQSFADAYRSNGLPPQRHGLSFRSPEQWQLLLAEAGFADIARERKFHCEHHPSVRDFLHSVKAVGASASEAIPPQGISRRALFADMYRSYEARFRTPGGSIPATYDLLLLQARTPS